MFERLRKLFEYDDMSQEASGEYYDVTGVQPTSIAQPADSGEIDWWSVIEQGEYVSEQTDQVDHERRKLYLKLCVYLDSRLRKEHGQSLASYVDSRPHGYYSILRTIYRIVDEIVTYHYGIGNWYQDSYAHSSLKEILGSDISDTITLLVQKYIATLPRADEETIAANHLAPNGLRYRWWDVSGQIRERSLLTARQQKLLDRSPYRDTVFWHMHYEVTFQILERYLKAMAIILGSLGNPDCKWSNRQKRALGELSKYGENTSYYSQGESTLPGSVLKAAEQQTRLSVRYARPLDVSFEENSIRKTVPKSIIGEVNDALRKPSLSRPLSATAMNKLRDAYSQSWKIDACEIHGAIPFNLFNYYRTSKAREKYMYEMFKLNQNNIEVQLLSIYYLDGSVMKVSVKKKMQQLIHEKQIDAYEKIANESREAGQKLVETLRAFRHPPRKEVVLDHSRVKSTQAKHADTVSKLNSFLGEDTETETGAETAQPKKQSFEEVFAEQDSNDRPELSAEEIVFLELILGEENMLELDRAKNFASEHHKVLGGFIQGINKKFYPIIEDQLIVQGDRIELDLSYIGVVKEVIKV